MSIIITYHIFTGYRYNGYNQAQIQDFGEGYKIRGMGIEVPRERTSVLRRGFNFPISSLDPPRTTNQYSTFLWCSCIKKGVFLSYMFLCYKQCIGWNEERKLRNEERKLRNEERKLRNEERKLRNEERKLRNSWRRRWPHCTQQNIN